MSFYDIIKTTQLIGVFILFIELVYIIAQKPSKTQITLIILDVSTIIMLVGYLVEMTVSDPSIAMVGVFISYIGKPFALLSSLVFITEFCNKPIPKKVILIVGLLSSIFPVAVYTNSYHHWYYKEVTILAESERLFTPFKMTHGWLYYIYMAMIITVFIWSVVVTILAISKHDKTRKENNQIIYICCMISSSIIGYALYLAGITKGYDSTMAGAFVGSLFLTILFIRYDFFNTLDLAKDRALQDASTGLLVLDSYDKSIYTNSLINKLLKKEFTLSEIKEFPIGVSIIEKEDKVYEIQKKEINKQDKKYGTTIEITDITVRHNYATQLEKDVKKRVEEIQHIQRSIVTSFSGIVEARDDSTGDHIKRISSFTEILSRKLLELGKYTKTLNEEYITCLTNVSPLHDIGKLKIPDNILMKPGKLTDEEFEIMKTHANEGAKIVDECLKGVERDEYVNMARDVAKYHHEKWNGCGYPENLSGETIPLSSRIVAVADVYDAIRSVRCYKPAMSKEDARKVIKEGSGNHFDPNVVDAFFASIDEIEAVSF